MRKSWPWLLYSLIITLLVIFQTSFFPQFILFRIKPDVTLLFVISIGLLKGNRDGALTGALAGIIAGIISWNVIGMYVLVYSLAGFTAGLLAEKIEPDVFVVPILSSVAGSVGLCLIFMLLGPFFEIFYLQSSEAIKTSIYFTIINAIFAVPTFLFTRSVAGKSGVDLRLSSESKSSYLIK